MRIAIHVYSIRGAGHLTVARTLAEALADHEIIWLGHHPDGAPGSRIAAPLAFDREPPPHGQLLALAQRGKQLAAQLHEAPYDVILTEHFPFGGRYFDACLHPLLTTAHRLGIPIVGSVRDIIGKDRQQLNWAHAALQPANDCFSGFLWHGDPRFVAFDFPFVDQLRAPVVPTGYLGGRSSPPWSPQPRHWVASCGSGRTGGPAFSRLVLDAQRRLEPQGWKLTLVCGPDNWRLVQDEAVKETPGATILPWIEDLPALLATAAVSVSQCGYMTFLDVIGSRAPAVFVPHSEPGDDEQLIRAQAIARFPGYRVQSLDEPDACDRLAEAIVASADTTTTPPPLAVNGAETSARCLLSLQRR